MGDYHAVTESRKSAEAKLETLREVMKKRAAERGANMGNYPDSGINVEWAEPPYPAGGAYEDLLNRQNGPAPKPTERSTAGDILKEAHDIVVGARNVTHGEKERSFSLIASFWQTYLDGRKDGGPVTAFDVAMMMSLLKIARSIQGTRHRDHATDLCGYGAIAGELM